MTDRERLVELINGKTHTMKFQNSDHWFDFQQKCEELADYLLANGVIVLPCKVGDTVYQTDGIRIYESKIKSIIYDTNNFAFDETAIGKSVFLTREEAEKALKEREENGTAQIQPDSDSC